MGMDSSTAFRDRAVAEQANADSSPLQQVRDRSSRAAAAWHVIADQVEQTEKERAKRDAAKADQDQSDLE